MLRFITFYQRWISPWLPPHCRYYPTCSQYAAEAVREHGKVKGGLLGAWRILRCNPFSLGGYDPVPCAHSRESGCEHAKQSKPTANTEFQN